LMRSPLSRFQTPTAPRRDCRFFQVWWPSRSPRQADHSAYFELAKSYFGEPFQPSTEVTLNIYFRAVNAAFQCNAWDSGARPANRQSVEMLTLSEWMVQFSTVPHNLIHNNDQPWVPTLGKPKGQIVRKRVAMRGGNKKWNG
jgi:hypothetical protein